MNVKEFYESARVNGFTTHLNDDVNVYVDDETTAIFNKTLESSVEKPDYFLMECFKKYYICNGTIVVKEVDGDTDMEKVYWILIQDMVESKNRKRVIK